MQQEEKLKEKYHVFLDEFQKHASEEGKFNLAYQKYNVACSKLDEIIFKFQSYSDPLQFYNQSVTN